MIDCLVSLKITRNLAKKFLLLLDENKAKVNIGEVTKSSCHSVTKYNVQEVVSNFIIIIICSCYEGKK